MINFSQVQTRETRRTCTQAAWRWTETEEAASRAAGVEVAASRPDQPPPPPTTGTFHSHAPQNSISLHEQISVHKEQLAQVEMMEPFFFFF